MSESKIQANTITNFDGTGGPNFPNGFGSGTVFPAGHIVQIVNTVDNTRRLFTNRTANTWYSDYTALDTSITPKYATSKLLVNCNISFHSTSSTNTDNGSTFIQILKNGSVDTELNGDTSNSFPCFGQYRSKASTVTSSIYEIQVASLFAFTSVNVIETKTFSFQYRIQSGGRFTINRDAATGTDLSQGTHSPSVISTITIMEVAQ